MKRCVLIIVLLLSFFPSFAQNEQEAEKHYGLAVNAFTSNNLTKSLELFRKCDSLRTKDPNYVGITANTDHWLGYVYYRLGEHEQALQESMYYYQIPPEDYRMHVKMLSQEQKALNCVNEGDYRTALTLNKLCLEQYIANLGENHYFVGNTYFGMANLAQNVAEDKDNVLTYFDKGIACFASMGEKGRAAMQFITINKCHYLQQNLRHEEACKCLPMKDELFPQHKAFWYLLNCNYEATIGNYEEINNLVSEFENDTDCCNDTIYYQYIKQLDIASYGARGMLNECADKGLKLLDYLENKHGSASIEYLEYSLFVGDYLRNAGRLMEETLLYLKICQTADSSFYLSFNEAIDEPDVPHPLLRVMGQMLARLITASKLMGMGIGHIEFCEKSKTSLDLLDWTKRKDTPDFQSLLDLYWFAIKALADEEQKNGNTKEDIKYYEDALAIPAIKESTWARTFMQNCAILYYQEKDYQRSIDYFEKSYDPDNKGMELRRVTSWLPMPMLIPTLHELQN